MSKLKEYIKLLPKGLPNSLQIVEGVFNEVKLQYNSLSIPEKEEITRRRILCGTCPYASVNAPTSKEYKELTGKYYSSDRTDPHCALCGCPTRVRTASLSSDCGIESWNKEHPENPLTLKWTKYL